MRTDNAPVTDPGDAAVEPLRFTYELPPVSERKLALIKLVAKYTVVDPQQIESHTDREFDFLDPKNSLHTLFKSFVNQYELVAKGAKPLSGDVLSRAIRRAASHSGSPRSTTTGDSRARELANHDAKQAEFFAIDWQDFVVLETVEFFSADLNGTSLLSAPLTKSDMALRKEKHAGVNEPLFKSALTGEMIPASQYNEHMRMLTLDSGYAQQKEKEAARKATTNLDLDNVADNIGQLRAKRRRLLEEG